MIKIKRPKIKKLTWGIAGCGYYAEHTFIPALSILRRSKLVSLYSHKKKRAQQLAQKSGATGYFNNYADFLNPILTAFMLQALIPIITSR